MQRKSGSSYLHKTNRTAKTLAILVLKFEMMMMMMMMMMAMMLIIIIIIIIIIIKEPSI